MVLIVRVFNFFVFFSIIEHLICSFCFLVELSHYWQVQLKDKIIGNYAQALRKGASEVLHCLYWLFHAFSLRHTSLAKISGFFYVCRCLSSFLLYDIYLIKTGLNWISRTYNRIIKTFWRRRFIAICFNDFQINFFKKKRFFNCLFFCILKNFCFLFNL